MEAIQSKHGNDGVCMSLPEDIIFDVLVRLPAKALYQFRCVSKAWRTLIADPAFAAARIPHAGRLIVGVFGDRSDQELRVLDMHGNILRVFKATDGPLLAPTQVGHLICVDRMRRGALIFDPVAGCAFTVGGNDDDSTWSCSSFGRAIPSGAYKVLHLYDETHTMVSEVATITEDGVEPTWRRRTTPDLFNCFSTVHKAMVNGVLYFMCYSVFEITQRWNRVAAFDIESEVWMDTINGPPLEQEQKAVWRIGLTELKGSLCMVHNTQGLDDDDVYTNIWRLMDDKKSVWVKAYMIRLPDECLYIQPFDILDDGRILVLTTSCSRYILQFFNPSTETFTDIMEWQRDSPVE